MPATASEAIRVPPAPLVPPRPEDRDASDLSARDWSEIVRVLNATDEDDVPLFGRLPA
jgi:hypothetical protein